MLHAQATNTGGKKKQAMEAVLEWLLRNAASVCPSRKEWQMHCSPGASFPRQHDDNSVDCGPYVLKYMDLISTGR